MRKGIIAECENCHAGLKPSDVNAGRKHCSHCRRMLTIIAKHK